MQRYFLSQSVEEGQEVLLSPEDSHHLLKVMRAKSGQRVVLVSNQGQAFMADLLSDCQGQAQLQVGQRLDKQVESPIHLGIAMGLSKNDKLEWLVQKATECGVHDIFPTALGRDVMVWKPDKQANKMERLKKIAKEAAEQSHRLQIPHLDFQSNLKALIETAATYDVKLIAYEEEAKKGEASKFSQVLSQLKPGQKVLLVFGSEGGLQEEEVSLLKAADFQAVGLGPRILRAETAPIYALSAISYHVELLNNWRN